MTNTGLGSIFNVLVGFFNLLKLFSTVSKMLYLCSLLDFLINDLLQLLHILLEGNQFFCSHVFNIFHDNSRSWGSRLCSFSWNAKTSICFCRFLSSSSRSGKRAKKKSLQGS